MPRRRPPGCAAPTALSDPAHGVRQGLFAAAQVAGCRRFQLLRYDQRIDVIRQDERRSVYLVRKASVPVQAARRAIDHIHHSGSVQPSQFFVGYADGQIRIAILIEVSYRQRGAEPITRFRRLPDPGNVLVPYLVRKAGGLGFMPEKEEHTYEDMKTKLLDEAKRAFKPEFMNRLDDLIVFRSLSKDDMGSIVEIEVSKVIERVKGKEVEVVLTAEATDFLIEKGYDPQFGARPLRRAVEKYLQDPLAVEILRGNIKPNEKVEVSVAEDALVFHQVEASAGASAEANTN